MTVGKLIEKLQEYDPEFTAVCYQWQDGNADFAYPNEIGEIFSFETGHYEEEEEENFRDTRKKPNALLIS